MNPRAQEILESANDIQRRYVIKRLTSASCAHAARALGIHRSTPHHWHNYAELEECVSLLLLDAVQAAKLALEGMALDAAKALERAAKGKGGTSVRAATAILDRIGLPAMSQVDVTSKGESIKATVYIPDNGRNDRDD